ncbi:MAG TPA: hypothetical protein VGU69_00725, partial [Rhizomicrobium sp.]|nr:hypothetical protein [Rhizomicrobium sp.]
RKRGRKEISISDLVLNGVHACIAEASVFNAPDRIRASIGKRFRFAGGQTAYEGCEKILQTALSGVRRRRSRVHGTDLFPEKRAQKSRP